MFGNYQLFFLRFSVIYLEIFIRFFWDFQSFYGDLHRWFASSWAGNRPEGRKTGRPLGKGAEFHDRAWTDADLERTRLRTARSHRTYPSPDRAFGSERSEQSFGDLQSCFLWIFSVLFGFFVSYLDIFGRFLDFLCPIWRFVVAFGDFQSFYGDFVSFSWRKKNTSPKIVTNAWVTETAKLKIDCPVDLLSNLRKLIDWF